MSPRYDAAAPRMRWADLARAVCVVGVVLMHTVLTVQAFGVDIAPWRSFVDEMGPFRMSGLSMLSGLLLSRRIRAGWTDRGVRASVALSGWLYVVWLLVFALFALGIGSFLWAGPLGGGSALDTWLSFARQLVLPETILWYVLALAVWTALLATLRRLHPAIVLAALVVLSAASFSFPPIDGSIIYYNVCRYAFFFALGVYGSPRIRDLIARRRALVLVAALVGFVLLHGAVVLSGSERLAQVLSAPRDVAGALIVLSAAALLSPIPAVGRGVAWIGRRTLPIYVMHGLLLEAMILFPNWWVPFLQQHAFARSVSPIVIALGCVAVAVTVQWLAMRTPARVLFALPEPIRRRIAET